jgi:L-aminopeptidase/D-esterase-like protein
MATTLPSTQMSNGDLQAIFNAGADVLGRAVVHAVLMSKQIGTSRAGYCQQYPSACVKRTGK